MTYESDVAWSFLSLVARGIYILSDQKQWFLWLSSEYSSLVFPTHGAAVDSDGWERQLQKPLLSNYCVLA